MIKIFLLLTLTLILCVLLVSTVAAQSWNLVWEAEPKWYEVNCAFGVLYYNGSVEGWEPYVFNMETREFELTLEFDWLWGGGADSEFIYDRIKNLYGCWSVNYDVSFSGMIEKEEFLTHFGTYIRAFREVDSDKIKWYDWELSRTASYYVPDWIKHQMPDDFLDEAYIGDKYAIAYGVDFVTDFIYDYNITWLYSRDMEEVITVKLNGKWGAIGKHGETLAPFVFDDFIFIDNDSAFVKYNGKYGILDVKETSLSLASIGYSPQTGEKSVIYLVILLSISIILINHKNKRRNRIHPLISNLV